MSFSESAHDDFMAQATKANQTVEVAHDGMTLTLKEVREGIHDVLHSGHSMRASVLAMFPTVNRDCVIFIVYTDDDGNVTHTREIVGDEASDPERQVTLICSDGHAQLFQPDDPLSTEDVEALVEKMLEADPSIDHEVIRASGYEPALDRARVSAAEPIVNVDKTPCVLGKNDGRTTMRTLSTVDASKFGPTRSTSRPIHARLSCSNEIT